MTLYYTPDDHDDDGRTRAIFVSRANRRRHGRRQVGANRWTARAARKRRQDIAGWIVLALCVLTLAGGLLAAMADDARTAGQTIQTP